MQAADSRLGRQKKEHKFRYLRHNIELYSMMMPVLVIIFIFSYIPLFGLVIAFQNYVPGSDFFGPAAHWAGLKNFTAFINSYYFGRIMKNTIVLSLMGLAMGFWVPIVFALLVNELWNARFKKIIQTVSYLPYFVSMVVVAGMILTFIANDGLVPKMAALFGWRITSLNTNARLFPWLYTFTNVWKSFGWGSILYLSTISSIDQQLYEVAYIDGADRWRQVVHITIPHMVPLIAIQLIFAVGALMNSNSELILLMYNPSVYSTADVIGTYTYREGLIGGRFSYGTASNMLMSVMSFILVFAANGISRRVADFSLW